MSKGHHGSSIHLERRRCEESSGLVIEDKLWISAGYHLSSEPTQRCRQAMRTRQEMIARVTYPRGNSEILITRYTWSSVVPAYERFDFVTVCLNPLALPFKCWQIRAVRWILRQGHVSVVISNTKYQSESLKGRQKARAVNSSPPLAKLFHNRSNRHTADGTNIRNWQAWPLIRRGGYTNPGYQSRHPQS